MKTIALLAAVAALFATAACSGPADSRDLLDPASSVSVNGSAELVEATAAAIAMWNEATDGAVTLSIDDSAAASISAASLKDERAGEATLSLRAAPVIRIDAAKFLPLWDLSVPAERAAYVRELTEVTAHELGHAFGLKHTSELGNVRHVGAELMASTMNGTLCVDAEALAQFCALWACGPAAKPTCAAK